VETAVLYNLYRLDCRSRQLDELPRRDFVRKLCDTGKVREICIRVGISSSRGLAGVRYAIDRDALRMQKTA
jgi:hypothetical protein